MHNPFAVLVTILLLTSATFAQGLDGRVMCGYQGWFRVPEDGSGGGWHHYASGDACDPATVAVDLWPDVSELPAEEQLATGLKHRDGSVARVFSSVRPAVSDLHFRWMQQYGIDGVFLQRFAGVTRHDQPRQVLDQVLVNSRSAAHATGRKWVLMYDLSGVQEDAAEVVIRDFERLREELDVANPATDSAYLTHRDRPLVALWGLGFNDRPAMLDEWQRLIDYFHDEALPGGMTVMLGVPTYWRTLDRDTITDPELHTLIAQAEVVSPWSVGRYASPDEATRYAQVTLTADKSWCDERGIDLLPVAFPGFSWHNLMQSRGQEAKTDQIPRRGGEFFRAQTTAFRHAGLRMLYVAMFDELDEGTAIFKLSHDVPIGAPLVDVSDVPSDHYLKLAGAAGTALREAVKD